MHATATVTSPAREVKKNAEFLIVLGIGMVIMGLVAVGAPLISGIVSLLLGILIWRQWPLSGVWAVGLLVGINIVLSGWSVIALGTAARRVASEVV